MASNSIREIRPYLLKVLDEIFKNPPRPPKFISEEFPSIALLVDATTVRCSVQVGDFDDARQLFDGHHNSYSMKIEVAVSAWPPFKAFWSIMADKGYQGHFIDDNVITPIKRIHKANKTMNEKEFQRSELESIHSLSSSQPSSFSSSQPSFSSPSVSSLPSSTAASSQLSLISFPTENLQVVPVAVMVHSTQSGSEFSKAGTSVMSAKEVEIINKIVVKHRIPVEWFFGRLKRLWLRLSD
ncbi:uncharacterized protein MONOS_12425 [Monocercomonoides exilis]|uniref:uncharacterized protein n=1 Tax=Monocercomonoides exilis TaxID=2049356 RepID=UPI0035598060|nr:hypothetical protein MONOS_12425 [Monocercomonoides exilis]|eukprot:MONOS_12425.1-p1 / transcript=MONOS_12425.1 / gene=MONOS_12425 / organism=Monocercomonoides_exilis_PA203 / gene_product=unspecified product / transcript_product=unspecified product / location=Mono_scaffold00688:1510-2364(-) / protein_length=240 / sequence_SO=supercontig / SO=protein_coding / is_pseudo=false